MDGWYPLDCYDYYSAYGANKTYTNSNDNLSNPARNGQLPGRQWGTSGGDGGWKMEWVVDQKSSCHHHLSLDITIYSFCTKSILGRVQFWNCVPPQLWLVLSLMGLAVLPMVLQANTSLALSSTIVNKVINFFCWISIVIILLQILCSTQGSTRESQIIWIGSNLILR